MSSGASEADPSLEAELRKAPSYSPATVKGTQPRDPRREVWEGAQSFWALSPGSLSVSPSGHICVSTS